MNGLQQKLSEFSDVNWARCVEAFNCGDKSNLYWITALSEELGELAGAVKKLDRGFNKREFEKTKKKILAMINGGTQQTEYLRVSGLAYENEQDRQAIEARWLNTKLSEMAFEGADVFIYLMLFFRKNGLDLLQSVDQKFNQVSVEMGCPQFVSNLSK